MRKIDRILLVDDDKIANHHNSNLIAKHNFANETIIKTNGKDALDYLKTCKIFNLYPNLILLDLSMPVMDGFEFLKIFQKMFSAVKQDIFIVILTTSRNGDDIIKLKETGHLHLVNKPLTIDTLMDINHKYFRKGPFEKIN